MPRITILFLLLCCVKLTAQEVRTYSKEDSLLLQRYLPKSGWKNDSLMAKIQLDDMLALLYSDGYLAAGYSIISSDSLFIADWSIGDQYKWANLGAGNLPEYLISKIGYRAKFYQDKLFSLAEFKKLFNAIIRESDMIGRPFASVVLDSIQIAENRVEAVIHYESGPEITFDRLRIEGTDKISIPWLESYLSIQQGKAFNQSSVDAINEKIEALPFVTLTQDKSLSFQNLKAEVKLFLSYEKSNSLDGIIGFLPNEQEEGKLLITGQLFLGLTNLFNSGKSLSLEWQSLKARSQLLDISYSHPNILKSPIDLEANFNLLKEDTFFINREFQIASVYRKVKSEFSLFYRSRNSSVLSELALEDEITDFSINYYGVGYQYSNRRRTVGNINRFNISIENALGSKKEEFNLLDSVDLGSDEITSIQYQTKLHLANQLKVSRTLNFYTAARIGVILNENELYRNDLFRVGGLQSIRGFNENFFFADRYAILKAELRLYYQPESFLFLFYDQGFLQYNVLGNSTRDNPLGVGLGMALKVSGGLLNIAYGLGKSEDQDFDTRLSKFHFGYVARF